MCCFEPKQEKQAVMDVAYCNLLKGSIGRVCGYRHGTVYHNEPVTVKQCHQNDCCYSTS